MVDYELLNIILEMEKTGVEYGQYIMTGMFGFVIAMFLLGQRMTLLMVNLIVFVYSAYVIFLIVGIVSLYERVALLAASAEGSEMMKSPLSMFLSAEGYQMSGYALAAFWIVSYLVSIVFSVLVRRQRIEHPKELES